MSKTFSHVGAYVGMPLHVGVSSLSSHVSVLTCGHVSHGDNTLWAFPHHFALLGLASC